MLQHHAFQCTGIMRLRRVFVCRSVAGLEVIQIESLYVIQIKQAGSKTVCRAPPDEGPCFFVDVETLRDSPYVFVSHPCSRRELGLFIAVVELCWIHRGGLLESIIFTYVSLNDRTCF